MSREMKKYIKIMLLSAALAAGEVCLSYGAEGELAPEEFAEKCEEEHFSETRYVPLPEQGKEEWSADYALHWKEILLSPDGKNWEENPYDMKHYRSLFTGKLLMDFAEGYTISYEYYIRDESGGETVIAEGGIITPYYQRKGADEGEYSYTPNEPEKPPIIPDLPPNYDWKKHGNATLSVYPLVTICSLEDGSTYSYESRITSVTNLYKEQPDCYFLGPTDAEPYVVRPGDNLWKIGASRCEEGGDWVYIFRRNKERILDPDRIYPGMLLVIPNVQAVK